MATILIVDNHPYRSQLLSKQLAGAGYRISLSGDIKTLPAYFNDAEFDLVLINLYLEGFNSWEILLDIKAGDPSFPVLIYAQKYPEPVTSLKEAISKVLYENEYCNLNLTRAGGFHMQGTYGN